MSEPPGGARRPAEQVGRAPRARRARRRLRHLDLDLEEPMGGICGTNPHRIRQIRLAEDGIDAHLAIGVEVGRPC